MLDGRHPLRRALVVAAVGSIMILGAGWTGELWRFGLTPDSSFARVERAVARSFGSIASSLQDIGSQVALHHEVSPELSRAEGLPRLFAIIRGSLRDPSIPGLSVTVYDGMGVARAWAGRPSEIPSDRVLDEESFFVAPGPVGLRLVYVRPVLVAADSEAGTKRVGSVAVERVLSPSRGIDAALSETYRLRTPIADVALRAVYEGADTQTGRYTFGLRSPAGARLLVGEVEVADLVEARLAWRRTIYALALAFLAFVLVGACAPLIVHPAREIPPLRVALRGGGTLMGCLVGFALLRVAIGLGLKNQLEGILDPSLYMSSLFPRMGRTPADLLLVSLLLAGVTLVVAFLVDQARFARRHARRVPATPFDLRLLVAHLAAGAAVATLLLGFNAVVGDTFNSATVDVLHTSLHPWDSGRLAILGGLLLASVATIWGCATILVASQLGWRVSHRTGLFVGVRLAVWITPGVVMVAAGIVPMAPCFALLGGAAGAAAVIPHLRPRFRHASHAARMMTAFLAFLLPTLLAYPSLQHHGEQTRRRLVETHYAVQAASHPEELQAQLYAALGQIDAIVDLADLTAGDMVTGGGPDTDRAFFVWRQTDLASRRLTSAVELYRSDGQQLSRFALNFPEYAGLPAERQDAGCDWEVYGEIAPFGSDERRVLHAERAICRANTGHSGSPGVAGSVVVHVALDYRTLPFISSGNPYTELLRPTPLPQLEGRAGQDVELVIYGWGRQPLFSSGQDAWPFSDALFGRIYASREPFWTTLSKGGRTYTTYLANDRVGIYALGYPMVGAFDHLVHLAEISTLAGGLFILFGLAVGVGSWLTPDRYRFGRALLREIRTSFYRRLLLAFIAATLVPVLALALVIRGYFTAQLRADVEAGAARTAAIAQRVIEEAFVLQQVGEEPTALINDDLLVWISQVLDQEINIFNGSQLVATSERDLFASGLLPTRTPDAVYSAIALEQLPSYVMEDAVGALEYLVAATPIRAAGRDAILTVPLASRQQEIEREIDDLDRGILLGVAIFVLIGAAGGLYMAERIADPVKRLTRATGQIARGDFEARVAVRSADEFQRLVAAFNQMAIDLQDQQVQLEKTHRLEAWADMARQVAHEIKNPLTPVQLSAEHLRRVHADRGEPLGPVLENCVDSILTQVRLLRQISSEFSSYASSPSVELRPTSLRDLVSRVLDPYRIGLEQRILVEVDIPGTIPELNLDRTLVARAIANVIENALHAMPGEGRLEIRAAQVDGSVVLTIADSGVGLDRDTLARIFEPYFSTKVSGTGLGMAIAKRNIELSGGTISVESQKDHGTTVALAFPLFGASLP